jgi:hypothetical protein
MSGDWDRFRSSSAPALLAAAHPRQPSARASSQPVACAPLATRSSAHARARACHTPTHTQPGLPQQQQLHSHLCPHTKHSALQHARASALHPGSCTRPMHTRLCATCPHKQRQSSCGATQGSCACSRGTHMQGLMLACDEVGWLRNEKVQATRADGCVPSERERTPAGEPAGSDAAATATLHHTSCCAWHSAHRPTSHMHRHAWRAGTRQPARPGKAALRDARALPGLLTPTERRCTRAGWDGNCKERTGASSRAGGGGRGRAQHAHAGHGMRE